jgi:hypothetical protein
MKNYQNSCFDYSIIQAVTITEVRGREKGRGREEKEILS